MILHRPPHIHTDDSTIFLTGRIYAGISWLAPDHVKEYILAKLKELTLKYAIILDAYVLCQNHYHLIVQVKKGNLLSKFMRHLHGATAHYIKEHLPDIISLGGQVLTRDITPWDKRQAERLNKKISVLERELKFATTEDQKRNVIAQFIARHPQISRRLKMGERGLKSAITSGEVVANFSSHPDILVLLLFKDPPIWYQYMDHVIRDESDYYKHLNYIHQNPVKHGLIKRMSQYPWSSIHEWIKKKGKEFVLDSFRRYPIVDFQPIAE